MTKIISALTARTQLGQIMKRSKDTNERFLVERRGVPQVLIMSLKDYIDSIAPTPQWLKAIQTSSKRRGTSKLTMRQINSEVSTARREKTTAQ